MKFAFNALTISSINQQLILIHHANQNNMNKQKIYHDQKEKKVEFEQFESHNAIIKTFF